MLPRIDDWQIYLDKKERTKVDKKSDFGQNFGENLAGCAGKALHFLEKRINSHTWVHLNSHLSAMLSSL